MDLTGGRYSCENTFVPNVAWIDTPKLDFSQGRPEMELQVEKRIFSLHGDVTSPFETTKPLVFGTNKRRDSVGILMAPLR
jgi:choloylglycine hydrolase